NRHGFYGRESFFEALFDSFGEMLRLGGFIHAFERAATQMIVEAQPVADWAAQQLANGLVEFFAFDIPQGLVDAADGRVVGDAAAPEILAMHDLPEVFNAARVFSDQEYR